MRRRVCARAFVLALLALGGCNDDGRTLEPTTATMPPEIPATAPTTAVAFGLRVSSPDVVEGVDIDPSFTCDGAGVAPQLILSGAPSAAAELAVAIVDLDAADRVHFVASGLPSTTTQLDPLRPPAGAVLGRSAGDVPGWEPPCPPPGDGAHRYEVRAYVMAEPVGLTSGLVGSEAVAVLERAAIEVARLEFTYAPAG